MPGVRLQGIAQTLQAWLKDSPTLKPAQQDEALHVLIALLQRGLVEPAALAAAGAAPLLRSMQDSAPSAAALWFVAALHAPGVASGAAAPTLCC